MRKRFYIGLIVLAVLLLALGRLIVHPPATVLGTRRRRSFPRYPPGPAKRGLSFR